MKNLFRPLFFTILSTISLTIFFSCNNKEASEGFIIRGQLINSARDQVIYLEELNTDSTRILDSAVIKNGEFLFRYKSYEIGFYLLRLSPNNFVTLLIDTTEHMIFKGNAKELPAGYSVEGSEGSRLIAEMNAKLNGTYKKFDSLQMVFNTKQNDPNFAMEIKLELDSAYLKFFIRHQDYIRKLISNNMNSLASLIGIYQIVGRTPLFNGEDDYELFLKLDSVLIKKYPQSKHALSLHDEVNKFKKIKMEKEMINAKLQIGSIPPEIILFSPDGEKKSLSSLKGKYVLLDFWASWCKPCRNENPNLVMLYKKYHKKGLEIFAVSLDRSKTEWTDAIKKDKLGWIHVSDLKEWKSVVVRSYNIDGIPLSYLLDKDGKIIAKGLRGEELSNKLQKIIK